MLTRHHRHWLLPPSAVCVCVSGLVIGLGSLSFGHAPKASDIGSCPHRRKTQPANSRMWRFWCDVSFRWNKGALWMCGLAPPGGGNWAQISARTRKASIIFPRQRGRSVVTCVCVGLCLSYLCDMGKRTDGRLYLSSQDSWSSSWWSDLIKLAACKS